MSALLLEVSSELHLKTNPGGYVVLVWLGRLHADAVLICSVIFISIMENILRASSSEQKRILKYPALGIRKLGLELSFVTIGFFVFVILLVLAVFLISPEARTRLKFFVDTHFFANKYDYRKEWGELSGYLSIALNENQIIHVTSQVILDSMYTHEPFIRLKDSDAFPCPYSFPAPLKNTAFRSDTLFIEYLEKNQYLLRKTPGESSDELWERTTGSGAD